MTTHLTLKDTHTLRCVTIPDAAFDNHAVDRICHVMEVGIAQLQVDIETFGAEEERALLLGDAGANAARCMSGMVNEFERYVQEATNIVCKLRALNDVSVLAAVNIGENDTSELIEVMTELLNEDLV